MNKRRIYFEEKKYSPLIRGTFNLILIIQSLFSKQDNY